MLLKASGVYVTRARMDELHAAQVVGLMGIGTMDAVIAVWDAKNKWWTARPITEDPTINMYIQTPAWRCPGRSWQRLTILARRRS